MDSREASIQNRQGINITPPPFAYHHYLHTNSNPAFAFNSLSAQFDSAVLSHQQQQQQQQQQNGSPSGAALDAEQLSRRRRGRPRKYSPDSSSQIASMAAGGGSGRKEIGGEVNGEGSEGRRRRGRPPGSGKKQLDALGGVAGSGLTPHVIKVLPKEDVVSKVNEFCQEGPRTIIIISAYGAVCNATTQRPGSTDESGTIFHEGYSDILNLAGPFFYENCDGSRGNNFDLTISLVGSDGKSSGGRVLGKLIAATTIQIIAASCIMERKKSNGSIPRVSSPLPTPSPHMLLAFGLHSAGNGTAPIEAATDSSDDNGGTGSGTHSLNHSRGQHNNTNYPMHSLPMYQQHLIWGNTRLSDTHRDSNNNNR